jgi:hypothetical protein
MSGTAVKDSCGYQVLRDAAWVVWLIHLQVLKLRAASQHELQQAEAQLQQAIAAAEQLSEQQDGLLVESNKACAAEAEAADGARSALAMLLCQSGREAEAAVHLAALGFKFRLSNEVGLSAMLQCNTAEF